MRAKTKICSLCKEEKLQDEFYAHSKHTDGKRSECKVCSGKRDKKYHVLYRERHLQQMRNRHKFHSEKWLQFMQNKKLNCCVCGYHKCHVALEYHHNNPKEKEFEISWFIGRKTFNKKNQQILLRELGKCLILCANCHREFHYNQHQRQFKQQEECVR